MPECCAATCDNYDAGFLDVLRRKISAPIWPPHWSEWSIDGIVEDMKHWDSVECNKVCSCLPLTFNVSFLAFAAVATEAERQCEGLCLSCVKEGNDVCWFGDGCKVKGHH